MSSLETPKNDPPTPEDFEWAWKWFEIHVKHRTDVVNFFLVAFGALAVAYADLLDKRQASAATAISLVAFLICICVLLFDIVTMTKIEKAKEILSVGESKWHKLFVQARTRTYFGLSDRYITRGFEIIFAIASVLAAYHAWACSSGAS